MKKTVYLLLFCLLAYNSGAQTTRQIRQLATLGKVWGFLKYYHSAALKGKPDWDKELLRMIPLAEQTKTGKPGGGFAGQHLHGKRHHAIQDLKMAESRTGSLIPIPSS
jgi:hypothetical protein